MEGNSVQQIISLILSGVCSPPCRMDILVGVVSMLASIPPNVINTPVMMDVPEQGVTNITILESAIIMRWPEMVQRVLMAGASPNVSTSGSSLVQQLIDSIPISPVPETQIIIDMLLQAGAWVPPGFPGTQGYLIDRPLYAHHRHGHRHHGNHHRHGNHHGHRRR